MSFSRVNAGGWASGDKVTTAQVDALDTDIGNSLDKNGPDGIFGALTFTNQLKATNGAVITSKAAATTASGGRVVLGDNDYPTLKTPISIARVLPLLFQVNSSIHWTTDFNYSINAFVGANGSIDLGSALIDGATLASVDVYIVVAAHSVVPQAMPNLAVDQVTLTTGAQTALVSQRIPTAASANAWYNNSQVQSFNLPINTIVDRSQYGYFLSILDESGTGAVTGNQWHAVRLNMTGIVDMRPA